MIPKKRERGIYLMLPFVLYIVKLLLLIAVLAMGFCLFRKRFAAQKLLGFGVLICFYALVANIISGFLPPLTEQVTLTALGEQREEAKGQEVCLEGFTIDGKKNNSLDYTLEIVDGHWFWSGNLYCWRPETDSRQPEGITRAVVIKIPVGQDRTLDFSGNKYRGSVEISIHGEGVSKVLDTYSASSSIVSESIGGSETSALIWNQIRYLALYAITLLGLSAVTAVVVLKCLSQPDSARIWMKHNSGRLIYGCVALVTGVLMVRYADKISLWYDEMYQVGMTNGTLKEALLHCLNMEECSPPLQLLISTIWYRIAPYGEKWLFVMPIMVSVAGIYLIGITGERINGVPCGALSVILTSFSTTVWTNIAYEYRAYPFFLFFSSLVLYCYVCYNQSDSGKKQSICFSCAMACLAMTHYFGMLACAGLFIADVCLFFKKQVTFKRIIPYLLPGVFSVVWLGAIRLQLESVIQDAWQAVPSFSHIRSVLLFISGNVDITYWLLWLGISAGLAFLFMHSEFSWKKFYFCMFSMTILCTILLLVFYGNVINPSSTMWSNRYFTFLLPCASMLSGMTLYEICNVVGKNLKREVCIWGVVGFCLGGMLFLNCLATVLGATSSEPYREAADWIYTQSNYIFNKDSIVIVSNNEIVTEGWNEYYVARQGRQDQINVASQHELTEDAVLPFARIYLVSIHGHDKIESWLQNYLKEYYTLETDRTDIKVKVYVRK